MVLRFPKCLCAWLKPLVSPRGWLRVVMPDRIMRDLPDGFTLEGTGGDHPGTWLAPFVPSVDWLMRQMPKPG
jgi:hypothetical protein